jgi:hypothetical protein
MFYSLNGLKEKDARLASDEFEPDLALHIHKSQG